MKCGRMSASSMKWRCLGHLQLFSKAKYSLTAMAKKEVCPRDEIADPPGMAVLPTALAIACEHGWPVWQMDVVVAFLQAHIDKDVYVKPAPGHDPRDPRTGEVMVYKLERSLYGLAQSPVLWYDTIDGVLIVIGFSPTHSDPCVYVHERKR